MTVVRAEASLGRTPMGKGAGGGGNRSAFYHTSLFFAICIHVDVQ